MRLLGAILLVLEVVIKVSSTDPWNELRFRENAEELAECLEEFDVLQGIVIEEDAYETIAQRLRASSMSMEELWEELPLVRQHNLVETVIYCSENEPFNGALPIFEMEEEYPLVTLLNLILVDVSEMNDLSTMLSYVRDSLPFLEVSRDLRGSTVSLFNRLNLMFFLRSLRFFDHRSNRPYIRHLYSFNRSETYTEDNPHSFIARRLTNFGARNPTRGDTTEVEAYFLARLNQFLRTSFFCLELVDRGLVSLNYQNVNLSLSHIPHNLVQLLVNDTAFERNLQVRCEIENNYARGQIPRDNVVTLLLTFWHRLRSAENMVSSSSRGPIEINESEYYEYQHEFYSGEPNRHPSLLAEIIGAFGGGSSAHDCP